MATGVATTLTGNASIDGLLSTRRWNVPTLTFNFPNSSAYYPAAYFTDGSVAANYTFDINAVDSVAGTGTFEAASAAMIAAYRTILPSQFAGVSLLSFTELAPTASSASVDISVARANLPNDNQAGQIVGHAFIPGGVQRSGDTWYATEAYYGGDPLQGDFFETGVLPGGPGWFVMLHEAGHSVGLKHAHEDGIVVPANLDSYEYTVMTYRDYVGASTARGYNGERYGRPQTLMMLDIRALQHLYGADYTTNAGNTVYTFSPTTGQMLVNGVGETAPGANRIFRTIWDGNGVDTYDLSNYAGGVTINLAPGAWSTFSQAQLAVLETAANSATGVARRAVGNVANALQVGSDPRSLIENAIGGAGNDALTGNSANNALTGNGGTNSMSGAGGWDRANYALASTAATITRNANGTTTISGAGFSDTLSGIEIARFSDRDVALKERPASDIDGNGGSDIVLQSGGTVVGWLVGGGVAQAGNVIGGGVAGWTVVGTGDFDGDGTTDALLQNGGTVVQWTLRNGLNAGGTVLGAGVNGWSVVGTGDFNADGTTDVVLQNGGTVVQWRVQNGAAVSGTVIGSGVAGWSVVGTGDFNGDGSSDVLLQNGGTVVAWNIRNGANVGGTVLGAGVDGWTVVGTGDFNGDGTTDVVLQNGGTIVDWIVRDNRAVSGNVIGAGVAGWTVAATGDYNGDGTTDIALQNGSTVVNWSMQNGLVSGGNVLGGAGGFTVMA